MYEYLKKLFGTTDDGQPEALTFDQLTAKIEADTGIKLANLADGGYVSKDKFDAKATELEGVQQQLTDANATIQSYKDMDIDGIKKAASDWEEKYNTDTAALQKKLADQEYEFAARSYLSAFPYANDLVKDAVYAQFMAKEFKREGDKFLGADDFMAEIQKANPTGFVSADPPADPPADPAVDPKPRFAPPDPPSDPKKRKTLSELMKMKNEHPDAKISYD